MGITWADIRAELAVLKKAVFLFLLGGLTVWMMDARTISNLKDENCRIPAIMALISGFLDMKEKSEHSLSAPE